MRKLLVVRAAGIIAFCIAAAIASPAQSFYILWAFDKLGQNPLDSPVQGVNGNFYGTTSSTVFEITPAGKLITLYTFSGPDGTAPVGDLVLGSDRKFYGTTSYGGAGNCTSPDGQGCGTVFEITETGALTTLHSFDGTDGDTPLAGLVQASNGNFYGTTSAGGAYGLGTVFEITPAGNLTTLHSFDGTDGKAPVAGLIQASNGDFYGTTNSGGAHDSGTVFEITQAGKLNVLYSFCSQTNCTDGIAPVAGLVQATNGKLYGTASSGGAYSAGTFFAITVGGNLNTLYSFGGSVFGGGDPTGTLVQAANGNFYGTTEGGGGCTNAICGTVFEITPGGVFTPLGTFDPAITQSPYAGLTQGTNGTFYGTTTDSFYGVDSDGTLFSLSVGLAPFVKSLPASGKVGASVVILGNDLTGATSVTFNGAAATFSVVRPTEITATVPKGATTGTIVVTDFKGKQLKSNIAFLVIQ
jgi:uncharacterized repeat protein (TIGR03803 family)